MNDFYSNNSADNLEKLQRSVIGDEIIAFQSDSKKLLRVLTYVAASSDIFYEASIKAEANGEQTMSFNSHKLSAEDVMNEINKEKDGFTKFYWNRRKFRPNEVDMLAGGIPLNTYRQITMEYSPMKVLADQKVRISRQLESVRPGTELILGKYRNGLQTGTRFYICCDYGKFKEAHKSFDRKFILGKEEKTQIVVLDNGRTLSTEDILSELPKDISELTSDHTIDIAQQRNKYTKSDMHKLLDGMIVNETNVEKRRKLWRDTDKEYSKIKGEPNSYIEHWVDKETHEVLNNRPTLLDAEKVQSLKEQNKILPQEIEIDKTYSPYKPEFGIYTEFWFLKGTSTMLRKHAVTLERNQVEELAQKGLLKPEGRPNDNAYHNKGIHRTSVDKGYER